MAVMHLATRFPIAPRDIALLADMLRRANAVVGALNPSADWYDPMWYVQEQALSNMKFTLLVDRNVYSIANALSDVRKCSNTDQHRTAAAALCFAHCCSLQIETKMALLEHDLDSDDARVHTELPQFHRVFAAGPKALAEFALGRIQTLKLLPPEPNAERTTVNAGITEEHRPAAWRWNYGCALKIASLLLDLTFKNDVDRLIVYLNWCYDEFFFSAAATVYGSLALSPKRKGNMFKKLRSAQATAAMRGIRNAAWDMTLLSEWEIKQKKMTSTKNHYLICSLDRAVTDVANTVMCQGLDEQARSKVLRSRFISEWGQHNGVQVFESYTKLGRTIDTDCNRPANQQRPLSFWNKRIAMLEQGVELARRRTYPGNAGC